MVGDDSRATKWPFFVRLRRKFSSSAGNPQCNFPRDSSAESVAVLMNNKQLRHTAAAARGEKKTFTLALLSGASERITPSLFSRASRRPAGLIESLQGPTSPL